MDLDGQTKRQRTDCTCQGKIEYQAMFPDLLQIRLLFDKYLYESDTPAPELGIVGIQSSLPLILPAQWLKPESFRSNTFDRTWSKATSFE